jgi:hypothetical protein
MVLASFGISVKSSVGAFIFNQLTSEFREYGR